jgi:hypothetical protein
MSKRAPRTAGPMAAWFPAAGIRSRGLPASRPRRGVGDPRRAVRACAAVRATALKGCRQLASRAEEPACSSCGSPPAGDEWRQVRGVVICSSAVVRIQVADGRPLDMDLQP